MMNYSNMFQHEREAWARIEKRDEEKRSEIYWRGVRDRANQREAEERLSRKADEDSIHCERDRR